MGSTGADPEIAQVIANELRLLTPDVRRDRDAVAALLDPRFREVGASGRVWDRDAVIELLVGDDTPPPDVDEMAAVCLGSDVVLLTYRTRAPGRTALRSSLWHRRDGNSWQIVFHQGTTSS
jgi:hypothetical protein